jgi:AcrR family transcriptional regulator
MGKPHKQRKLEIIQSTLALAAELGVKKVTTQAIADRVGVAQATIFRHFKTRDAIFADAIEWLASQLFQTLSGCFSGETSADQRLQQLISKQLQFISQHKGLPRLLFSDRLHLESPVLKQAVQKIMNRYVKEVAKLIQEGVDTGHFRDDLNAEKTAYHLAALMQGLVMRWSIFNFNFDLEQEADDVWDFINHSLRKVYV